MVRSRSHNRDLPTMVENFAEARADYSAAKASRFRRQRTGLLPLGSNADWHYRIPSDYFKMMEYARDMDRNDLLVGQMVDRAVDNAVQDGFTCDPQTGDRGLDNDLRARWDDWAADAQKCDISGEHTWWDMEWLALRHCFVDGDLVVLPIGETGQLQMVEAHRLRTPAGTKLNVVHGIKLNKSTRRREEYWLTREDVALSSVVQLVSQIKKYATYDHEGNRQIFHPYVSKRISQTRGVTAFAPIFDSAGMVDDIQFAKLVQQQLVSCFALIRERSNGFQGGDNAAPIGAQSQETLANGVTRILQGYGPGMEISSQIDEKLRMDSPRVPNAEYFQHIRQTVQFIGINLGLPLILALMDASETNFSGWRGAFDQAKLGFRRNQKRLRARLHIPAYQWRMRWEADNDPTLKRFLNKPKVNFFGVRFNRPTWPYIQPLQDASADLLRLRNGLISPRRRAAERGIQYTTLATEICADNALLIAKAHRTAEKLNKKYKGLNVSWREVASLPTPDGVKINVNAQGDTDGDPVNGPKQPGQPQPAERPAPTPAPSK